MKCKLKESVFSVHHFPGWLHLVCVTGVLVIKSSKLKRGVFGGCYIRALSSAACAVLVVLVTVHVLTSA
jgi:hypothetical protein